MLNFHINQHTYNHFDENRSKFVQIQWKFVKFVVLFYWILLGCIMYYRFKYSVRVHSVYIQFLTDWLDLNIIKLKPPSSITDITSVSTLSFENKGGYMKYFNLKRSRSTRLFNGYSCDPLVESLDRILFYNSIIQWFYNLICNFTV